MSYRSTIPTKRLNPLPAAYSCGDGSLLSPKHWRKSETQALVPTRRSVNKRKGKATRNEKFNRIDLEQLMNEIREVEADLLRLQEEEQDDWEDLAQLYDEVEEEGEKVVTYAEFTAAARAEKDAAAAAVDDVYEIVEDNEKVEKSEKVKIKRIELEYCWSFGEDVTLAIYVSDAGYDADIEEGDDDDEGEEEEKKGDIEQEEESHYGIAMCSCF